MIDNSYTLKTDFNMASVAISENRKFKEDLDFINESVSDILKVSTLAALLAIPGIVDSTAIAASLNDGKPNKVVQVSDPKVQKKIYDAIGKDKYNEAVIVNILARTLMGEGGGESSSDSIDAIATVIWNRAHGDRNKFISTVFAPSQFSCWNKMTESDKRNFIIRPHGNAVHNPKRWDYCVNMAKNMVDGNFTPVDNWTAYYAHKKVTPSWSNYLSNVKEIDNHTFGFDTSRKF